jgi:hypothetical protein
MRDEHIAAPRPSIATSVGSRPDEPAGDDRTDTVVATIRVAKTDHQHLARRGARSPTAVMFDAQTV